MAIEQVFDHSADHKKSSDVIPAPVPLDTFKDEFRHKLTILNRITIIYAEPVIAHAMVNNLLSYTILVAQTQRAFVV